jgi:hypothetical protein
MVHDSEEVMFEIYVEKEINRKEKLKWISILDSLPIFVMIFDKAKQKVTYINQYFRSIFFPKIFR